MDGFEKHIRNNRSEFDEFKADRDKMWKHIQAGLATDESSKEVKIIPIWKRQWFMVAASIVLIIGLGMTLLFQSQDQITDVAESTELMEIDLYYDNITVRMVQQVKNSPELSEEEKAEFLLFMDEMDEEYQALKDELNQDLDNEQVLEAIIIQHKKRIDILQSLLNRINQSKNKSNEKGISL